MSVYALINTAKLSFLLYYYYNYFFSFYYYTAFNVPFVGRLNNEIAGARGSRETMNTT